MSLSTERAAYLLQAWTDRDATAEEERELINWLKLQDNCAAIGEHVSRLENHYRENDINEMVPVVDWDQLFRKVLALREEEGLPESMAQLNDPAFIQPSPGVRHLYFLRNWWWAASIILFISVAAAFLLINTGKRPEPPSTAQKPTNDILPGGNKAVLILSDGTSIALDQAANGTIAQQGNATIIKSDGQLLYDPKMEANGSVLMNTMLTPRGGQFQLTLPDATKVWLNAGSSITYPVAFTGNERNVKISGEVYFEVTANKAQPFIVDVDGISQIKVLGTHFNINSYADEGVINTTLLEGSILASVLPAGDLKDTHNILLKPGQQAQLRSDERRRNGFIVVDKPDLVKVMAWKNGLFNFDRVDLQTVLRQLARWYDLSIRYEGSLPVVYFQGEMERGLSLMQVIEVLAQIQPGIGFELEGKTLIVRQKKI